MAGILGHALQCAGAAFQRDRSRSHPELALSESPLVLSAAAVRDLLLCSFSRPSRWWLVQFDMFYAKLPDVPSILPKGELALAGARAGRDESAARIRPRAELQTFQRRVPRDGLHAARAHARLYCNVSDSWMLQNKWHRAAIGAAGMYVELVIAAFATFVWWFTEPGLLNQLALNAMFVCSVSTLIFNGNPLLRYDGYYILADLTEIPNLRQKATDDPQPQAGELVPGVGRAGRPVSCRSGTRSFSRCIASHRRCIAGLSRSRSSGSCNKVFEPYGLQIIGQLIGLAAIGGLVVRPLWQLWNTFGCPAGWNKWTKKRFRITIARRWRRVVRLHVVRAAAVPRFLLGRRRSPRCENRLCRSSGHAESRCSFSPGQQVRKAELLAELENYDLRSRALRSFTATATSCDRSWTASSASDTTTPQAGSECRAFRNRSTRSKSSLANGRPTLSI